MEKDWVVVLYGDDSSELATVNANVRTIDQVVTMITTIIVIKNFHRNQHTPGVPILWTSADLI